MQSPVGMSTFPQSTQQCLLLLQTLYVHNIIILKLHSFIVVDGVNLGGSHIIIIQEIRVYMELNGNYFMDQKPCKK